VLNYLFRHAIIYYGYSIVVPLAFEPSIFRVGGVTVTRRDLWATRVWGHVSGDLPVLTVSVILVFDKTNTTSPSVGEWSAAGTRPKNPQQAGMFSAIASGGSPRGPSSSSSPSGSSSSDDEICFECVVCIEDVRTVEGEPRSFSR
jgi:hypothetical protein